MKYFQQDISCAEIRLGIVGLQLQSDAKVAVRGYCDFAIEANQIKFNEFLSKGNKQGNDFKISIWWTDMEFSKLITSHTLCLDSHLNNMHIKSTHKPHFDLKDSVSNYEYL